MPAKRYFAYARHALVAALNELGARPGDSIAVPELICRDVLASFHHVGVSPSFYEVNRDLQPVGPPTSDEARFVLMVNYFGFAQNIEKIQAMWPTAQIIEDNAHGFLSRDEVGRELGTRTEAGFTSCRKTLRIPDGAWLYTARGEEHVVVEESENRYISTTYRMRMVASEVERKTHLPINTALRMILRAGRRLATGSSLPKSDDLTETCLPSKVHISHSALQAIKSVDATQEVNRRRELFFESLNFAREYGVEPIYEKLPEGLSPYGFPFYSPLPKTPMTRFALRHHCEVISWPDLPSAVVVPDEHHYRQLRVVNFL